MAKLTNRQQAFAREYLVDLNATQAAIRAGYAPKSAKVTGARLLTNANVSAAVQAAMDERAERTELTADYVLDGIRETIERCQQVAPILDRQGNPVFVETPNGEVAPAFAFDAKNVLRGFELLGKHLKLFTERHEHSGPNGGPIQVSDTEASARVAALLKVAEQRRG